MDGDYYREKRVRTRKYEEMGHQGAKKAKAAGLYLAGVDKKTISRRLDLPISMVELYIKRAKEEIQNAERKL